MLPTAGCELMPLSVPCALLLVMNHLVRALAQPTLQSAKLITNCKGNHKDLYTHTYTEVDANTTRGLTLGTVVAFTALKSLTKAMDANRGL